MFVSNKEKGLTLVEVLLAIVLISTMGMIWVGSFGNTRRIFKTAKMEAKGIFLAQEVMERCLHSKEKIINSEGNLEGFDYKVLVGDVSLDGLLPIEVRVYHVQNEEEIISLHSYKFMPESIKND